MDKAKFNDAAPGELVSIAQNDWAFLPDALPPAWEFPLELWPTLAEAKQQLGLLEGIARQLDEPNILLRPLQRREALRSSSLEGTYATPDELLLFEMEPTKERADSTQVNAWREVYNYSSALRLRESSDQPISLFFIKQLHTVLLSRVRGRDKDPGNYRSGQVHIGVNRRFTPPPATHVPKYLEDFEGYIKAPSDRFDALVNCFLAHYQFETIHPFSDGNGRVGRLLLAMMIQDWCGLSKPWLYMSAFFDRNKDEYIDRLFSVSSEARWADWLSFCLQGTIEQAKDTVQRAERLRTLRSDFHERATSTGGNVRLHKLVDQLFQTPFVTIADMAKQLGVTYPTARSDFEKLESVRILSELPDISPKTYVSREVYDIAFRDSLE